MRCPINGGIATVMTLRKKAIAWIGAVVSAALYLAHYIALAKDALEAPTNVQILAEAVRRMFADASPLALCVLGFSAACLLVATSDWWLPHMRELISNIRADASLHTESTTPRTTIEPPSSLQVIFSRDVNGCRSSTSFNDGTRADFYRLLVRPPEGQPRLGCTGTLVDIMAPVPMAAAGSLFSFWSAERLRLTWATHTSPPVTTIDLTNNHGEFLDVFFVTENGTVGFGTPNFAIPASLDMSNFVPGHTYIICVSLGTSGEAAQEIRLALVWPNNWQNVDVTRIS